MNHKAKIALQASALTLAMAFASGCATSTAAMEDLETRVGLLEQEVAEAKSSAASAAAAQRAAESAQATADAALKAANESQACCDATNEKIDRMFERSQSK